MRFLHLLRKPARSLAIAALVVASTTQAETQPAPVISSPLAGAVILRSEHPGVTMQSLHVLRQLPLADIEGHPIVMVGKTRLDFKPAQTMAGDMTKKSTTVKASDRVIMWERTLFLSVWC